jgi:hypothetical protein
MMSEWCLDMKRTYHMQIVLICIIFPPNVERIHKKIRIRTPVSVDSMRIACTHTHMITVMTSRIFLPSVQRIRGEMRYYVKRTAGHTTPT